MSDIIAYKRLTLYQSIEECYKKEQMFFLKNVMMNIENNSNYTEVWNQSIISDNELPNECKNILIDFGKVLGKTNLKSQIGFFSYYIKQLQELNISKKTALSSKSKLYNSIGVLIGAFIVIIFI
jgi:stage III sporulation protein AB